MLFLLILLLYPIYKTTIIINNSTPSSILHNNFLFQKFYNIIGWNNNTSNSNISLKNKEKIIYNLLIFWQIFGLLTILDPIINFIPIMYLIKYLLLLLLQLHIYSEQIYSPDILQNNTLYFKNIIYKKLLNI